MDKADYIEKSERQLHNKEHQHKLSKHQTTANNETVHNVIEKFRKKIFFT